MSNDYLKEAKQRMDLGYEFPIRVLVWGPGKTDRRGYKKREKIKTEIKRKFPKSIVYFSEDHELRDITQSLGDPIVEEIIHADAAHIIIILGLETSRGANFEIDFFSQIDTIARKLWVLLPEKFSPLSGMVAKALRGIDVAFFSDTEFEDCTLASVKCINIVLNRALDLKYHSIL
jgi:hypothetical protein